MEYGDHIIGGKMIIEIAKKITKCIVAPIEEQQDEYMKDHILTPNRGNWKDDRSWRR